VGGKKTALALPTKEDPKWSSLEDSKVKATSYPKSYKSLSILTLRKWIRSLVSGPFPNLRLLIVSWFINKSIKSQ